MCWDCASCPEEKKKNLCINSSLIELQLGTLNGCIIYKQEAKLFAESSRTACRKSVWNQATAAKSTEKHPSAEAQKT